MLFIKTLYNASTLPGGVAQLVEQRPEKPCVTSSNLVLATTKSIKNSQMRVFLLSFCFSPKTMIAWFCSILFSSFMKRYIYLFLAMTFSAMILNCLYYILVFSLVYYKVIPILWVVFFTDYALSPEIFQWITFFWVVLGYIFGRKWWKIIYIDKVYHFGKPKRKIA